MKYTVELRKKALEDINSLDAAIVHRILKKLNWLKENFEMIIPEPLKGELKGLFKLRIGDYRILYTCDYDEKLISVHLIGHRKNIYR
ncbi:type II toxin-antitoxin system RelE/ParE family toxin [bacterium]|nr:type II toxin-antitoxin system RelE/ParE family toxin [bacterium]